MNKRIKTAIPIAGAALALSAVAFMVAPGRAGKEKKAPFYGRNFAHRGLHRMDKSVPENSLTAFESAAQRGYGIELDIRLTGDGKVVVFHDDELDRICGVPGRVENLGWEYLKTLRLCGTQERIPLLEEALSVINGRGPVIVELKRGRNNRQLCEKTLNILRRYTGPFCVESFDPFIVRWFRKNAPDVLRGQLSCSMDRFSDETNKISAFLVSNVLTNFLSRPHFLAYGMGKKTLLARLCELMGAMKVAWVSRDWKSEKTSDAVIFEFYRPRTKFK
ncbi:MAG: glycerophosphodiester phosphodiesterase [Oscillospiraceae bacterium]